MCGRGWLEGAADLVLPGLGWVMVTGAGECRVAVHAPRTVRVELRDRCLMPHEVAERGASRFTGSVLVGRNNRRRPRAAVAMARERRRPGKGRRRGKRSASKDTMQGKGQARRTHG